MSRPAPLLLCALATPLLAGQEVPWRAGPEAVAPTAPAEAAAAIRGELRLGRRHVVVQLEPRPGADARSRLAAAGVRLLAPLGDGAFFAGVDPLGLDPDALARVGELAGVEAVELERKLHPTLALDGPPEWSVVGAGEDPAVAVYLLLHRDVALERGADAVRLQGGRVADRLESVNGLVAELPASRVAALAADDVVQWVEPPLPRMSDVALPNDSNSTITQADVVQAAPYGLSGAGVDVLVYDGGTARETHVDFGGRLTARDGSGLSNHATHVAATVGGSGAASGGTYEGMAPAVGIESYGFEYDGTGIFLYTNPGDLETDYGEAIDVHGADLANNSIGTNTETNGFPCNVQGDYGVCSSVIDAIVRGSLGAPFRVVWANGNERQGDACDVEGFGDYYSTAPPATAKNHLTVGALNSNDDGMTSFSSWGPTDDGRLKPDVSAPGCQSSDDGGVTSAGSSSDTDLATLCGTSMASPTACGLAALLIEDHRALFGGADPRNSTLRALFAHTAVDLGDVGPDHRFGYGSVRVRDAIDLMRLGRLREDALPGQGAAYRYTVDVAAGEGELRLTIAWDDPPGTPNVLPALVNDLDLVVLDPSGARRFPWTLDPADPGAPAVRDAANRVDNVEEVRVAAPQAGTWSVEVRGHDLPDGPQVFSIASSHDLAAGPFVQIHLPAGLPESVAPGATPTVAAQVDGVGESVVAGSVTLRHRYDGGAFQATPMTALGGGAYEATLPAAYCGDVPELYVEATGATSGAVTSPSDAPASTFTFAVEEAATLFADDFETDTGWSIASVSLTDGPWERGIPAGGGDRNDPPSDYDGSGSCYVTDNVDGNSDVDGGPTRLTSPLFDLSAAGDAEVRYARWFANDDFDADALDVEVSDDGGASWTLVESVGNTNGWQLASFRVADFVAPTAQVAVRFSATDDPNDSVTEAAIDAFQVVDVACDETFPPAVGAPYGGTTPGSLGAPTLEAFSDLVPGAPLFLVAGNLPAGTAAIHVGSTVQSAPPLDLSNGLLLNVGLPLLFIEPATADDAGRATLQATLPATTSGLTLYAQAFAFDGTGGDAFASANGLEIGLP